MPRRTGLAAALLIGSMFLASCGQPASAARSRVELKIRHSKFSPEEFSFRVGQRVTFVIQNTDPIDHEFILGDEGVQNRHELGTEAHHGAIPTEVSIPAKGEVETTVTFQKPGNLIIGCHLPGHYAYGMKARARIEV